MQNRTTVIHYVILCQSPLAGILRPFGRLNKRFMPVSNVHQSGFAVFDHQFAASVYLPMRNL